MKQTPEQRSAKRYPEPKRRWSENLATIVDRIAQQKGFATCIREEVEPKEAEIERLRALVQVLVDAVNTSQDVIFKMTDGPSFARWGPQLDINDSVMSTAKQAGFVPTNTTEG